jgi:CheY-like chemotaxis protein
MSSSTDPFQARILIVDDSESNVRLLDFTLRRGGYTAVTTTTKGMDVCALHRENLYDLILLDLQMPRMNGYEVLAAIATEPPVPILVLSADPTQQARALAAGAKEFLSKPFVLTDVLAKVEAMLAIEDPRPLLVEAPSTPAPIRAVC